MIHKLRIVALRWLSSGRWNGSLLDRRRHVRIGFDWRYGARPLQRVLETHVVTPLSRYLLAHSDLRGTEVRLDVDAERNVAVG